MLFNVKADIFVTFSCILPTPDPNKPISLIIILGYLAKAIYILIFFIFNKNSYIIYI